MTNRKSTKRALLGSVMAMVLCLAMLVGATFAWFTDTASTGVNKIQAGNLDVQLQYATAWDENGNVTSWADAQGGSWNLRRPLALKTKPSCGSRAAPMSCRSCVW